MRVWDWNYLHLADPSTPLHPATSTLESRTFSFLLNLHNLIKFRSVELPATCHEAYFNNKTRNNILTISVVLRTRHYLSNILKKSTTHESWQKCYENFPTNWVRSVKGCRRLEWKGFWFMEQFGWKTVCCREAPHRQPQNHLREKLFLQFVSHNFSLMRSFTHVMPKHHFDWLSFTLRLSSSFPNSHWNLCVLDVV